MSRDRPLKTEAKPPPVTFIVPPLAPDDPNAPTGALVPLRDTNSDDAIMAETASGDTSKFGVLWARHNDKLMPIIASNCPSEVDREGVAQDTWSNVITRAGQYEPGSNFAAWLFRIGTNAAHDATRAAKREAAKRKRDSDERGDPVEFDDPRGYVDPDLLAALQGCLGELPERSREIVRRRGENEDNQDIAVTLTLSPSRCSQLYHEILRNLRACVEGKLS